ncbi:MAG: recombinase family protein [Acidimicrobiia bacterium]|nr:recombinase family protein [Acidimicrobiia bacterium]
MRVVGYIRESVDPEGPPAFAQYEELRRHASVEGHHLVSVCSDAREPGRGVDRDGYRSVLGVIAGGSVDAVLLPGLATLSSDTIVQEIMLWDLRSRGVAVLSTRPDDVGVLGERDPGPSRMFIRDVLSRVAEHGAFVRSGPLAPPDVAVPVAADVDDDVVVHLITGERATADPDEPGSAAAGERER